MWTWGSLQDFWQYLAIKQWTSIIRTKPFIMQVLSHFWTVSNFFEFIIKKSCNSTCLGHNPGISDRDMIRKTFLLGEKWYYFCSGEFSKFFNDVNMISTPSLEIFRIEISDPYLFSVLVTPCWNQWKGIKITQFQPIRGNKEMWTSY